MIEKRSKLQNTVESQTGRDGRTHNRVSQESKFENLFRFIILFILFQTLKVPRGSKRGLNL